MKSYSDQSGELLTLLKKAAATRYGKQFRFEEITSYEQFREQVPLTDYDDLTQQIEQLKHGEKDLLWPGKVNEFAVSAGTTGSGKHLPVTRERLQTDRKFARDIVGSYVKRRKTFKPFLGKQLSLPGSVEEKEIDGHPFAVGEISGLLAKHAPSYLRLFQLASPEKLTQLSFSEKFDLILNKALESDIRVITAVPSWTLTLFQTALERTGKERVADIWPNLTLLVCGGVKLANYRPHLETLAGFGNRNKLDFIETYGASEGYFAFSDKFERNDLKLVTDNGLFYEWIPVEKGNNGQQNAIPTWEVESGKPYQMVVSNNAGLWRYRVKDIITFSEAEVPRIEVIGRMDDMLDDYGEATHASEAEQALQSVSNKIGAKFTAFTIGATLASSHDIPRHYWFIQWQDVPPPDKLAEKLDAELQRVNRHYAIRRESEALGMPVLFKIDQNAINRFFEEKNKRPAQAKLPKILKGNEDVGIFQKYAEKLS